MIRSLLLSVASTLILTANAAHAGDSSIGGVLLPWALVNKTTTEFLQKEPQRWRDETAEMRLSFGEFEVKAKGVRWDVFGQIRGLFWDTEGAQLLATRFSARVLIEEIAVDQIIERVVAGTRVRVHLKARCGPLRLHQDSAELEGRLLLSWSGLRPVIAVGENRLHWPEKSWNLADFECTGPAGFDRILREQVTSQLAEPEMLRPWLEKGLAAGLPQISREIEEKISTALRWTESSGARSLRAIEIRSLPAGPWISLGLGENTSPAEPPEFDSTVDLNRPTLWLKSDRIHELVLNEWSHLVPEWTQTDLRQNGDFLKLLRSRFIQFFVWPDLWNYKTSAPFFLSTQRPDIGAWKEAGPLKFEGPLEFNSWVRSHRGGRWWNYISVRGSGPGTLQVRLAKENLVASFEGQARSVKLGFGQEYKKAYPSTGWLAASTLASTLKKTSLKTEASWAVPRVNLGAAGGSWQAEEMLQDRDGWIRIPFRSSPSE